MQFERWKRFLMLVVVAYSLWQVDRIARLQPVRPLKVGVLFSLSGANAGSEALVVKAILLAIKEINNKGGLLGHTIEPIIADGKTDWPSFAREAERLITQEKVAVIFGCWTSASRKAVLPVVEKFNHLLFYPQQYEGLESSPNIVYTGAVPNQQAFPATFWAMQKFGPRIFMVGSDYIFPRVVNAEVQELAAALGAVIVGEKYIKLGSADVAHVIQEIKKQQPDFILHTIVGMTNIAFFKALLGQGLNTIPLVSLVNDDAIQQIIGPEYVAGSYTSWNYYATIQSSENKRFVHAMRVQYGKNQIISDPMEAGYVGVHLWAQAVALAKSSAIAEVKTALQEIRYRAPEGFVKINEQQHLFKHVRLAHINKNGGSEIVWESRLPITPEPYLSNLFIARQLTGMRSRADWQEMILKLYHAWGNKWAA